MSYTSIRNKKLIEFPDGKLMLLAECSDNNVTDVYGKRVWDTGIWHPKGTLYYTKESLKKKQEDYVEGQLKSLRDFHKLEVEHGWATEYKEPTVDSHDYNGTVWPGGSRIKNGRAFFGGKTIKAEDYFRDYGCVKTIVFDVCDEHYNTISKAYYSIQREDLDDKYRDALEQGYVYIGFQRW